jgi:hypothetical protein
MTRRRRIRWLLVAVGAVVVLGLVGATFTYNRFFRQQPAPYFESDEDHFLFGSVGTEETQGVPYWIWLVLPRLFPDLLPGPGGYASVGLLSKDGREMPIGLSKVTVGFPRVGINCAFCHTASVRTSPDSLPSIVPGAPAHQTSPQRYLRFLAATAWDPRFTAANLMREIGRNTDLSLVDRILYRFAIIPAARRGLRQLRDDNAWMNTHPDWGRGRIDPFNSVKFGILEQPVDATIGNSDMVPLWAFGGRSRHNYHWDGLNTSLQEVVLSSALGDGATRQWVDRDFARWEVSQGASRSSLRRVYDYVSGLRPPPYPFPIDRPLADTGAAIYQRECATCHASSGARHLEVIPAGEVGTDPNRLAMWTAGATAAYNAYGDRRAWKFSQFRKTGGYVAVPHDGLWLRAPYLHNGSVPSLRDLLNPPAERPNRFWRGYDVFDPTTVGFVTQGSDAEREGTFHDTSLPGNSNAGHLYGTGLSPVEKQALIEYLKTL